MPSDRFQIAAARAASSYPADVWSSLGTSEQAPAIYLELRKLDAKSIEGRKAREGDSARP
jgi:hypothetical protein